MSRTYTIELTRREVLVILAALNVYLPDDVSEDVAVVNLVDYLLAETGASAT